MEIVSFAIVRSKRPQITCSPRMLSTKQSKVVNLDPETKYVRSKIDFVTIDKNPYLGVDPAALNPDFLVSQGLPLGDFITLHQSGLVVANIAESLMHEIEISTNKTNN